MQDLKVIELASVLAGPSVGQFFAELGAEVIKVESPIGDVTRSWRLVGEQTDDRSAYFCSVNWGKKSVVIDLNSPEGKTIVHKLVSNADVVIASYKPGDAEKLQVDYQTLSSINPGVIYAQITGYGSNNARVGYDAVIQAEAGFISMNGEPGGSSLKMPVALIDILAAHHVKEGLLLAMLEKTKTGKGKLVEVSLIQAAVSSLANQASNWLVSNRIPTRQGSAHPNIAPYGDIYKTYDGKDILFAIGSDRQFQDLCKILKLNEVAIDPLFKTNSLRVENRNQLNALLGKAMLTCLSNELLPKIHAAKVPAGIVQNMQEVFEMPEAQALLISSSNLKGVKTFVAIAPRTLSLLPPPHLGEHTEQVLNSLSLK